MTRELQVPTLEEHLPVAVAAGDMPMLSLEVPPTNLIKLLLPPLTDAKPALPS